MYADDAILVYTERESAVNNKILQETMQAVLDTIKLGLEEHHLMINIWFRYLGLRI